jgi:hypothetical protein
MSLVPDYSGGGIANLMASLAQGLGGQATLPPCPLLPPEEVAAARTVVLWVVDGLGDRYLEAHGDPGGLRPWRRGRLTSVFPTTTASAVTTFLTGHPPGRHGVTGWFVHLRELGAVVAVLPGRTRFGTAVYGDPGVAVADLLGPEPFVDRVPVDGWLVSPAAIAGSPYNRAHQGGGRVLPVADLEQLAAAVAGVARRARGPTYVYAYWSALDHLGHQEGLGSAAARAHLRAVEAAFADLRGALAGSDALLVVTADHGQVEVAPGDWVSLGEHPELAGPLAVPLCGEPRAAYCHLRPGAEEAFARAVTEVIGERATLRRSAELVAEGWFGPPPHHPRLGERVGDRVLLMEGRYAVRDRVPGEGDFTPVGVHGGLSPEELHVPLCVTPC